MAETKANIKILPANGWVEVLAVAGKVTLTGSFFYAYSALAPATNITGGVGKYGDEVANTAGNKLWIRTDEKYGIHATPHED